MYNELAQVRDQLTGPGGPFEIHTVEVKGIPLRAYKGAPPDLRQIWQMTAAFADKDYIIYENERLTFAETHQRVNAIASTLAERFGVAPGDRVAIAMRNYPEWILAYWATISIGAAVVGMNAWWTGDEMSYALEDSTPKILIADGQRLERLRSGKSPDGMQVIGVRTDDLPSGANAWSELLAGDAKQPDVSINPEDDACIFYTSGTTGRPKGAQLTHRGCANNIMSMAYWNTAVPMAMQAAGRKEPTSGAEPAEPAQPAYLVVTPLFHVTACNCVMHGATLSAGKVVLMYKWDPLTALELIQKEKITTLSGVPVMSREIIGHPRFEEFDTSSLKSLGGGGAAIQPDLVKKIDSRVKSARPGTGYGMTEACGVIAMNSADFFVDKPETAGPLMPSFEGRIVDEAGNDAEPGQPGELWVRSSQVIGGYLNQAEATAETITDGWLHTGDIAIIDEHGFVAIVDRAKDMVLRGGENVYCAEVEAAIFDHDDVAECVVFGVPDDRLGEEVGAAIVPKPGTSPSSESIRAFVKSKIAAFKAPRYVWFQTEPLPRNASGKFLKKDLRQKLDPKDAH